MEQISRVPQARLVNTYRWKWKARLLASCGAMATNWPSLSTAPSPAARASARHCPTRARRRRLSPAQAGAGLLPLRGPARRLCPWARTQVDQAVTVQLLGWVSTTCSARAAGTRCCSRPPCSACSTSDLQRAWQCGRPARVCG